ncbi:MAG: VWA domain-containing protein [Deltaproteobacteria bacterium]|nr:MAG: VWA domain-containing protein [Deltaproteobacteria bacterium]
MMSTTTAKPKHIASRFSRTSFRANVGFLAFAMSLMFVVLAPQQAEAACDSPDLLIVLDRSCSMNGRNWSSAVSAVNSITTSYRNKLRFGLETFQSSASINYGIDRCIRDGSRCYSNLQSVLRGIRPSGGTNLRSAIDVARSHLTSIRNSDRVKNRKRSVMFITDGRASCADSNVRTLLSTLGVKTFVIGFGSGVDSRCLNNMATAGGTARSGSRKYYQADNSSELNAAMTAIANAASAEVCNNSDDDCDGQIDEGLYRSCRTSCGTGTERCSRGSWVSCSARQPTGEKCNGRDDDCDGSVDENWKSTLGRTCYAGTGNCRRSGRYVCNSSGTGVTCSARPAGGRSELCNGIDDDCDGQVDENFSNKGKTCYSGNGICRRSGVYICNSSQTGLTCSARPGPGRGETCNRLDDDCDGSVDEGLSRTCRSICGTGTETCSNGVWGNCNARTPTTERCNNIDDDCDGQVDENWPTKQDTCYAGTGNCRRTGTMVCNSSQNGVTCSARAGSPVAERCNGQDDDCDGQVDENFTTLGKTCYNGLGICRRPGKYICSSNGSGVTCSAQPGPKQAETCNELDDDCDGQIDENFTNKGQTCSSGTGSCQRSGKYVCKLDGSGTQCSVNSGQPKPESCNNIDDDCDGNVDEGLTRPCRTNCETGTETCSSGRWINCTARKPTPEECNGLDDDCDGPIDEDWPKKSTACTVGKGECTRTGKWVCNSAKDDVECSVKPGNPVAELCNGKDDDCDGSIDENWSKKGSSCTVGIGECTRTGKWVCNGPGSGIECSVQPGAPKAETCNNKDDDCDGSIDENLTQTCTTKCESGTETCNAGTWINCTARQPTPETCNGQDDDCDGSIDEDWATLNTPCTVGQGSCARTGVFICEPDGAKVMCSEQPGQPGKEVCNGQDDDCNGQVDELWSKKGTPCTRGIGECISTGTWVCNQAETDVECSAKAGTPGVERCNGKDDDCDGNIDEDWPQKKQACTNGLGICKASGIWVCKQDESDVECNAVENQPKFEDCNNIDDDCDGNIDEAIQRPCKTICGTGFETCNAGQWVNCDAQKPVKETCNGKDDDCNGLIDDTWMNLGKECVVGKGICERKGKWQCTTDTTGVECSVQPGQPQQEQCDGKDNDCDGQVDEDWPNKGQSCNTGTGACNKGGKQVCTPDGLKLRCSSPGGSPSPETCDGVDNDCNGIIDDGLVRACQTACGSGVETCVSGRWQNCSAPEPQQETCNGKDDNCDGSIDEGLTRICETNCGKGKETCTNGRWLNCTAPQPKQEICDAQDNDCDGEIDELPPKQCLGDCGQGQATCEEGAWTGCSGPAPKDEVCNGKDDDCNGKVDDNLSRVCRSDCGQGTEICKNGQWTLCNAPSPTPEVCNGRDDNCDGKSDNAAPCPDGLNCVQGSCRPKCRGAECPGGMKCINDICYGDACKGKTCPTDQQCVGGRCVNPCDLIKCPSAYVCRKGTCVKDDCYIKGCPSGQRCVRGTCLKDPCSGVSCGADEFCREGKCVKSCAKVKCGEEETCEDGKCIKDPGKAGLCKGKTCPDGHNCVEGKCISDPCYDTTCAPGQACINERCQHDPCHNIKCPDGQICKNSQCLDNPGGNNPNGEGNTNSEGNSNTEGNTNGEESTNNGSESNSNGAESSGNPDAGPTTTDKDEDGDKKGGSNQQSTDNEPPRYAPGCDCQSTQPMSPWGGLIILFVALVIVFRRRF